MTSLVSIDIETTGLESTRDAIIEIGAVRFNGKRVEDEWSTLINPGRQIPAPISALTGISNEMVIHAPPLKAVLQELVDFCGDLPVVGHNVRFDLSFLQRANVLMNNDVVDTYELAAVLMPSATRYNLGALGQSLGILLPATHRALDDARVAHALFNYLYDKALALPINMLAEFVRLSEPFDWGAGWLFSQVLRARSRQPVPARSGQDVDHGPLFEPSEISLSEPLTPNPSPLALDEDEVASILEHGGALSRYFPGYEMRPQQVEMLRTVTRALSEGQHLLVEAGTGTGKSFAYLIPAALWAVTNNERVVISTNTINLQEQLINKDIPDVSQILDVDLRAAVLKGRGNYLCPRRLHSLRERGPQSAEEMRVLSKVLVWLNEGGRGDRNEINLNGPIERDVWSRLSAEDEGCKAEVCMQRTGGACPFYVARQAAQSAHLIVINHALLLADIATGNNVLPNYDYLIVDEGHHLESATTNALSFRISQGDLGRLSKEIGGTSSGLLSRLLSLAKVALRPSDFAALHQAIQRATDLNFRLDFDIRNFFTTIDNFLAEQRDGQGISPYGQQTRILPATRTQNYWTDVEISWDTCRETLGLLMSLLKEIAEACREITTPEEDEITDLVSALADLRLRLTEVDVNLTGLVSSPDPSKIYWAEISPNNNTLALQVAPLHVGPLMEENLWHKKKSIIVTSATLTANNRFDYLRSRLNADEADELALGSPFDYETSALLYLANDIAEPSDQFNYQKAVEASIVRLAKATGGRMLVLFTSYAQLKKTSQTITAPLSDAGIFVYEQGEGASANALLESFRDAERAVLLGTRAFWEGVDIPGQALSVLVIVKLPFDVPTDPIIAARSETFEDPFNEYSLPEAILRFRQGFGRLIRTESDRGIVAILDKRIISKRYGKMFIDSLPECKLKVGPLGDLPASATRWLNM
jgi:ATP-dependent DNA helicase DinG